MRGRGDGLGVGGSSPTLPVDNLEAVGVPVDNPSPVVSRLRARRHAPGRVSDPLRLMTFANGLAPLSRLHARCAGATLSRVSVPP